MQKAKWLETSLLCFGVVAVTLGVPFLNYGLGAPVATTGSLLHVPDQSMRRQWERLEKILDALRDKDPNDPKAVEAFAQFLGSLVKEEEERTVLLQGRASTLLAAASFAIAIVVAMISLLLKEGGEFLTRPDINVLRLLGYAILLVFAAAFLWTWQGFTVRSDFATFNLDNLMELMESKDANVHTLQVVVSLQSYQVYQVNYEVNSAKGQALKMATANLFAGLFLFSAFSLYLMIRSTTPSAFERRASHACNKGRREVQDLGREDHSQEGCGCQEAQDEEVSG